MIYSTALIRFMSELRNTPPSSDQFDALIELLATDDASDHSNFHIVPEGTASNGLRDAEGKLDYAKIRSLFLQRRANDTGDRILPFDELRGEPNSGTRLPQVSKWISWQMDCLRTQLQIVVEEPTALADSPVFTEPLLDAESNDIEEIQKVHPFYLPWDGRKLTRPIKDDHIHSSPSVLPPEVSLVPPGRGVFEYSHWNEHRPPLTPWCNICKMPSRTPKMTLYGSSTKSSSFRPRLLNFSKRTLHKVSFHVIHQQWRSTTWLI